MLWRENWKFTGIMLVYTVSIFKKNFFFFFIVFTFLSSADKPPIEELHQFLEFQLPRQWAPVFGELALGPQRKQQSNASLQFSFMGPKLYVNTTPVLLLFPIFCFSSNIIILSSPLIMYQKPQSIVIIYQNLAFDRKLDEGYDWWKRKIYALNLTSNGPWKLRACLEA